MLPNPEVSGVEDCLYLYVYRPKVSEANSYVIVVKFKFSKVDRVILSTYLRILVVFFGSTNDASNCFEFH